MGCRAQISWFCVGLGALAAAIRHAARAVSHE